MPAPVINNVSRIDKARITGKIRRTDEGYLTGEAVVARTGILEYFENGRTVRELVTPEELSRSDSVSTLKMKPVTNNHPSVRLLNANNVKEFQVGLTGENIKYDDGLLSSSLTITDGSAITEVNSGKRELSCGYTCDLIEEAGVWNNQRYDRKQVNRRYNHVAICDLARAGSVASLHLDSADVYECGEADFKEEKTVKTDNNKPSQRSYVMPVTIKIDGIDYAEQAPEVLRHIEKQDSDITALRGKVTTAEKATSDLQVKYDALEAERDTLKTQLDKAKEDAKALPAQIAAAAKARADLVKQVSPHLDEETVTKIDDLSDFDLKKTVVLKAFPNSKEKVDKLDSENVDGMNTWYDAAIATLSDDRYDSAAAHNREQLNGGTRNDNDGGTDKVVTRADAQNKICNRYQETNNRDQLMA